MIKMVTMTRRIARNCNHNREMTRTTKVKITTMRTTNSYNEEKGKGR
jgi:hypothetical protein